MKAGHAFTAIEFVIVCVIIAICTLTFIRLYPVYMTSAVISEGITGAGAIRTALAIYRSQNGSYVGATLETLRIEPKDLEGRYFARTDYTLTNVGASTYFIKAGPPSRINRPDMPYYAVDQDGSERGTWLTNQ
jgi:type II secretory pathway pseudopilin PulG